MDRRRKGRKDYEPGKLSIRKNGEEYLWWPEHPLATNAGIVNLNKLRVWQEEDYDEKILLAFCLNTGITARTLINNIRCRPHSFAANRDGYIIYHWPTHPLSKYNGRVYEHWIVYWQKCGHSDFIENLLFTNKANIHHKDGNKSNNDPENLELRMKANHPTGVGEQDMIDVLTALGYKVE